MIKRDFILKNNNFMVRLCRVDEEKELVAKGWLPWMLTVKNGGQTSNSTAKAEHMGCRWTRGKEDQRLSNKATRHTGR